MPYSEAARLRSWSTGSTNALLRHVSRVRALTVEDRGRLLEAVAAVPTLPPVGSDPVLGRDSAPPGVARSRRGVRP